MIFRRKAKHKQDLSALDGVVTFFSSHHALKGEHVLKTSHRKAALIPGPREISPNCGTALRFEYAEKDAVCELFTHHYVQYEDMHYYPVPQP